MKYNNLPGTSIKISRLCLGTMMFGDQTSEADSLAILDYALGEGINFIDTAASYMGGKGETIIGMGLKGRREDMIIATKIFYPVTEKLNDYGLNRRHIIASVEASLKRLNTDYIDLVYLHAPDHETELEETMDTFSTLVRNGKIRYIGVSNFAAWEISDILALCDKRGYIKPIISQNVYNVLIRDVERELLPCLSAHKMGLAVYNPIAAGLLSGKYKTRELLENTRFANKKLYYDRYWNEKNFNAVEKLNAIAERFGISLLELAYRWCDSRTGVSVILCGASKLEQLKQNIKILEGPSLNEELLKICDEVWNEMDGKTFLYYR